MRKLAQLFMVFAAFLFAPAALARVQITIDLSAQRMDVQAVQWRNLFLADFVGPRRLCDAARGFRADLLADHALFEKISSFADAAFDFLPRRLRHSWHLCDKMRSVIRPRMAASAFRRPTPPRFIPWFAPKAPRSGSSARRRPAAILRSEWRHHGNHRHYAGGWRGHGHHHHYASAGGGHHSRVLSYAPAPHSANATGVFGLIMNR